MSTRADACPAAVRWRRVVFKGSVLLFALAVGFPLLTSYGSTRTAAATSSFSFNWTGAPASPQPWAPGQLNDWDLISNIDGPTDANGSMEAGHGADCSAPPATHHVVSLNDSAFICKNHMMTAINGGGDAYATYGGVYFAPAQQVDWSQGQSSVSWNISTERLSTRDWWQVNLTPFEQNMVLPLNPTLPAYQGEPASGLELRADNGICNLGRTGTIIRVYRVSNGGLNEISQGAPPCVEDFVSPSATTRTRFQIDVSTNHLKVSIAGTSAVWYDGPANLPFSRAVLQFSHHSYSPLKGVSLAGGANGPNTYHWSDINISSATPFTMLRPQQPSSLHNGQNPGLTLPQPAPGNAFLRFAGLGNFDVSFDGGGSYQPARVQGANNAPEHFASFWTPVPAGTTQLSVRGHNNIFNQPWWVQDVSVWAEGGGSSSPPTSTPPVIQGPPPTPPVSTPPTPTPGPITNPGSNSNTINFRSASTARNSGWVWKPARVSEGDVLLAALEVDADPAVVTPPAGWTLINDTRAAPGTAKAFHGQLYYKVAGASEPSVYHFITPARVWTDVQVLAYSGVDPNKPIDSAAGRDAGTTTSPSSPSLKTTSNNDRLVLVFINFEYGRWAAPAGMSKRTDFDSNTASDRVVRAAGPVGAVSAQTTTQGAIASLSAALRPA